MLLHLNILDLKWGQFISANSQVWSSCLVYFCPGGASNLTFTTGFARSYFL